jgi:hypothetical protein
MTVGSCTDTSHILISESSTAPSAIDAGWIACSTGAGDFSATVTGESLHTLYAWAKDSAGNVAASANNISMTYDTTSPVITPTTPSAIKGNVSTGTVSWTLTETNVAAATNFAVEIFNGTAWSSVGTVAANVGINTDQSYSLTNFTVPNVDIITAKFRVTLVDGAGLSTTIESGVFTIDSTAPVLSSVSINSGAAYAGTSLLSLTIDLADNLSSASLFVKLAMANSGTSDCQSEYVNLGWQAWTSSVQNFAFTIAPVDGIKKVCVWGKDAVGNVSVMSPTAGTDGMNYDSILFQVGNPPQITTITAANTSNGTTTYTLGNPVTINWAASDTEGLDNNPIALSYSTDNTNWKDVVTGLDSTVSANVTWMGSLSGNPTTASGSYTAFNAPSSSYFIIKVVAKDIAGNISIAAQSQPQNTTQWSIFAGTTDRGDGGSGTTAALYSGGSGTGLTFAINPMTNDIYSIDEGIGIRKLNVQTGKVSTFITHGTPNLPTNGTLTSTHRVYAHSATRMIINPNGIMYLMAPTTSSTIAAAIYKINLSNNHVDYYFGGGLDNSTSAIPTDAFVSLGAVDVDASGNLYYMTDCNTAAPTYMTGKKLMMVSQNGDGTAGVITHLAGNCGFGSITSGQLATTQPVSASSSTAYTIMASVAAVNPNLIYFSSIGNLNFKIINGVAYSVTIGSVSRAGQVSYNRYNNKMYRSLADKSVAYFTPSSTGAGGETLTTLATSTGSGSCVNDGVDAASACVVSDSGFAFDSNGIAYFLDGIVSNAANGFRIRYVDSTNKVRTIFGSLPFYGDGLNKGLVRGKISGIYYKKSTELNQTAFPAGLYLVSPSMIFGRINESDSVYHTLFGNQQGDSYKAPDGTTISSSISMGAVYLGGNGSPLTMDNFGLPWFRTNDRILHIDANNQVVNKTSGVATTANQWDKIADGSNPLLSWAYPYAGYQNFTLKGNGLFLMGGYTFGNTATQIPQIRFLDFDLAQSNIIMGGAIGGPNFYSANKAMSADITIPGDVKASALYYLCADNSRCTIQYVASQDRLYFQSNGDRYLRYISNPTDTAASTLTTMPLQFSSAVVLNFIFKEDLSQVFYITTSGLYCMDISSGKAWCNNSTNLYPYSSSMGNFSFGANQMTWKDSSTLLISSYNGKILQYILSP